MNRLRSSYTGILWGAATGVVYTCVGGLIGLISHGAALERAGVTFPKLLVVYLVGCTATGAIYGAFSVEGRRFWLWAFIIGVLGFTPMALLLGWTQLSTVSWPPNGFDVIGIDLILGGPFGLILFGHIQRSSADISISGMINSVQLDQSQYGTVEDRSKNVKRGLSIGGSLALLFAIFACTAYWADLRSPLTAVGFSFGGGVIVVVIVSVVIGGIAGIYRSRIHSSLQAGLVGLGMALPTALGIGILFDGFPSQWEPNFSILVAVSLIVFGLEAGRRLMKP